MSHFPAVVYSAPTGFLNAVSSQGIHERVSVGRPLQQALPSSLVHVYEFKLHCRVSDKGSSPLPHVPADHHKI